MWWNQIKTVLLLGALSGIFMGIGSLIGGAAGMQFALVISLVMNGLAYFYSDKLVLAIYRAKPLDPQRHEDIYAMVRELTHQMQLPMPKLWLIDTPVANAFATGRNPKNGSVALTSSIMDILEPHELRAVLAHELSHIKNRDILVSTIAATMATAISYLARMLQYAAFWGGTRRDSRNRGTNPFVIILVAILTPIAAAMIQLAISRSREYLADESGAHACREPLALASALEKIHGNVARTRQEQPDDPVRGATAPLFIVHPFTSKGWFYFFMTHPPLEARIKRLREIHRNMFAR